MLLVYDITNIKSFKSIKDYYIPKIKENCKNDVIIILLGNKADLEKERKVACKEGIKLALKEKYEFKESSCLQNKNVSGAFESLIEEWNFRNKRERGEKEQMKRSNTFTFKKNSDFISELDDIKGKLVTRNTVAQNSRIVLTDKQTPSRKKKCC